ncbi:prevent-host-death protein [Erwinia endophytica]|uniref:type II toxin-antitoxin system Phd/YefM family antitoxin n=1 Tax=Erwinia endophytica TaxID=1563158 RepID=UPI001265ED55|nr:type II toxin-antitoxin system Phd/YefM family antitoxin [Erwinia endophytica]KAB8305302.1 prevent-host-death protein [Erwinia endophytica]
MEKINIYEAKTNLSRLINVVVESGEPFVIARNGKALVKVVPFSEEKPKRALGFLSGTLTLPDNFDEMNGSEIEDLFSGKE